MPLSSSSVISHWYKLVENFSASPLDFYKLVEEGVARREVPDTANSRVEYREGGLFSARREYLRVKRGRHVFDVCGAPFGTGFFVSWWLAETHSVVGVFYFAGLLALLFVLGFIGLWVMSQMVGPLVTAALAIMGLPVGLFVVLPFLFFMIGAFASQSQGALDDIILDTPYLGRLYERLFKPETYYKIDTALMFQQAIHSAVTEALDSMTNEKGIRALSEEERKPIMKRF